MRLYRKRHPSCAAIDLDEDTITHFDEFINGKDEDDVKVQVENTNTNGHIEYQPATPPVSFSGGEDKEDEMSWEIRTDTATYPEYEEPTLASLQAAHQKQITHYRNLLVRAQSASSTSLHDLHSKLLDLESKHNRLQLEHSECSQKLAESKKDASFSSEVLHGVKGGDQSLTAMLKKMTKCQRVDVLGLITESCYPSDVDSQIALLEKFKRSRFDMLGLMDDNLAVRVLSLLDVKEVLRLRMVSKRYQRLTRLSGVWRLACRQLEWRDWDGPAGLAHLANIPDDQWEQLYKQLWRREKNWHRGEAQSVKLLPGHTNYVTALKLSGDTLISGSYDETIRIWDMKADSKPTVLPVRSVSCLDYHPGTRSFVVGNRDVGRVQVWRKRGEEWVMERVLSGHLHGIRAVAINDNWIVSAGADKVLVVWDVKTGEKLVKFGQQTNLCCGMHLFQNKVVAVTVDGVIRTFCITRREMIAQFKLSDLAKQVSGEQRKRMQDLGGGAGGAGTLCWFEGQGRNMTCATKDLIVRLAWDEGYQPVVRSPLPKTPASIVPPRALASSVRGTGLVPVTPLRSRTISSSTVSRSTISSMAPPMTPQTLGNFKSRSVSNPTKTITTPTKASSVQARQLSQSVRKPAPAPRSLSTSQVTPTKQTSNTPSAVKSYDSNKSIFGPLLTTPPKVLELISVPEIERGAVDARRTRTVTSTRFAARTGADRQLYVAVPCDESDGRTQMIPIQGEWTKKAKDLQLQTPEKNPMSIVMDRERFVYGCTDGTIVVVGFTPRSIDLPE